jgi:hypothetical protein
MVFPTVLGTSRSEPIFAGWQTRAMELVDQRRLDTSVLALTYRPGP